MHSLACLFADSSSEAYLQFGRLQSLSQWWHWLLLLAICAAVIVFIIAMYRRDGEELPKGTTVLLTTLRILAFVGILFFFLNLENRTVRRLVKNSRVLLLIDTSQSMGLPNGEPSSSTQSSRIERVVQELSQGSLLERLRAEHDVVVYRFDQKSLPEEIASYSKISVLDDPRVTQESAIEQYHQSVLGARNTALFSGAFLFISLLAGMVHLVRGRRTKGNEDGSGALLVCMVFFIVFVIVLAVANLRYHDVQLSVMLGVSPPEYQADPASNVDFDEPESQVPEVNWQNQLSPRGMETRIGEAIRQLVGNERGGPIAGIVLFSDGGNNAGVEISTAIAEARQANIPVYTVGLGSEKRAVNVKVYDLEAPQRVYPGDKFAVTGYLQANGLAGRTVKVELFSSSADGDKPEKEEIFEEEQLVELKDDGEIVSVKFEVKPQEQGRREYELRIVAPTEDSNPKDDKGRATVEVMERKNRVLLFASGPTREFRFARNLLYRDDETTVTVLLQSGKPGISQEADELIYEFPQSADELFEYDCMIAFDPDWQKLDELQIDLLDRWVAEKAGGLIVIPGPIYTPKWSARRRGDPRIDTIKSLYPVSFYSRGSAVLSVNRLDARSAWPLEFTREGQEAEFLHLEDDPLDSEGAWAEFDGVYSYFPVRDPKPGASVYARYSDPQTAIDSELPIYMAGHFYGAGRVFFMASGEIWRIRTLDESYFETFYTKLIRWTSQGRMQRDSNRGVLLVDKERSYLGDQITVRAILVDAQFQPLTDSEANAFVIRPDGQRSPLKLLKVKDSAREGMYSAQFPTLQAGDYRIELNPPHSNEDELLVREVKSRVPEREIERPERNDPLMQEIAEKTAGQYFVGLDAAINLSGGGSPPLFNLIQPQDQETYLNGTPDRNFEKKLMTWLMGLISGVLCLEWLIRRLNRLA